jgi:type II secretory pathway pseudopilin PulG
MKREGIKAITLLELLIALVMLGMVVIAGSSVTRSAYYAQRQAEDSAVFSLGQASQGAETMFQRISTAQSFSIPTSSEVRFVRQGSTGRIYQADTQLLYQSNIWDDSTKTVLLENVNTTTFSLDALNRVVMEIALNDAAQTKIRTAARTRNPYEPQVIAWMVID